MKEGNDDAGTKRIEGLSEDRTISSRERARKQLNDEVETFLAQGGVIDEVAPDVSGDPPRKPQPKYGSRPI